MNEDEYKRQIGKVECSKCGHAWIGHPDSSCPFCEARKLSVPNYWWDDRCLDSAIDSINDAVEGDEPGDVIPLRPIHELPTVWVRVEHEGYTVHATKGDAETPE